MKKILTFAAAALLLAGTASAVPAKPGFRTVTQSDGTTLQVQQLGDEFHHSLATADRLTIEQGADGDFYYSSASGITTMRAHDAASRSAAELSFLAQHDGQFTMGAVLTSAQRARARRAEAIRRATQVPNNGTPRVPIILVEYKDKKMSNSKANFEAQYKTNSKSVFQYFKDQSNSLYTPQFDIYGIYTLDENRSTYGGNSQGQDKGVARMVGEAIEKAGNDINWSLYDNNGDGEADVCIVVYAGVGEAQAYGVVPNAVWPCQWSLSAGEYYGDGSGAVTRNGTTIDKFAVFNEVTGSNDNGTTMDGIGTFCHEFSHCLGLPDFYETTYSHGYYGMGYWSLMNSGCYNGGAVDGDTPVGYSAYEKNFMGWIDLITPQENTQYTLPVFNSKNIENDQAIKITALNDDEYWILENRKKQGWDYYIQDEGVLITHFTYIASRWDENSVNDKAIQLATIIAADNLLSENNEDKDLYGETYHDFGPNTSPAMIANMKANGSLASSTGGAGTVNKPVTDIYLSSDGTASLWYIKGATPSLSAPVLADASGATTDSFTASWTHTSDIACTYTLNVTQGSTQVLNKTGITAKSYTVTGLEGGKTYTFKVKAVPTNSSQATESAWSNVKTVTLPEEVRPTIIASPTSLDFGEITAGTSTTKTFTVTGANLEGNISLAVSGANFAISSTSVTKTVAQGSGATITVTFTAPARASATYNGTVTLTSSNASNVTVSLTGKGKYVPPVITATPSNMTFENVTVGEAPTQTLHVSATNPEGIVMLTLNDENGVFKLSHTTITDNDAANGKDVTVTFTPKANVNYEATVTLASTNAQSVTVALSGNGAYTVPVMQPVDTTRVKNTSFRADWTDQTLADNVASYTLWVSHVEPLPEFVLLSEADFSDLTAVTNYSGSLTNQVNNASNYLPDGWNVNNYLYIYDGSIIIREQNSASNNLRTSVTLPEGFDKITVVVDCEAVQGNSTAIETGLTVSTNSESQTQMITDERATYTYVLNASGNEQIRFNPYTTSTRYWAYAGIYDIKIYAGDISSNEAKLLAAVETGDSTYRVVEGITTKFYVVSDLIGGGTYTYKVKAIYTNQTESEWSNEETVTLKDTPDEPEEGLLGDVNLDGVVDITDVNIVINIILQRDQAENYDRRAYVTDDDMVDVSDVNAIINIILRGESGQ